MPEAVEVKIIVEQLNDSVSAKNCMEMEIVGGRYAHKPDPSFSLFDKVLPLKIIQVKCKGKFIYWELEKDWYLWNTLGMTGGWSINSPTPHQTLRLKLNDDNYYFNDIRHFGTIKFVHGKDNLIKKLSSLGPDMLSAPCDIKTFNQIIMMNGSKTLAEILMNQKNFSGIGNYIKAEVLYRAKISPWRTGSSLSSLEINELLIAILAVMQESYALQGTTLANYKNLLGERGGFSSKLRVYSKTQDSLGNLVIAEDTPDKRTSWWCPAIQK